MSGSQAQVCAWLRREDRRRLAPEAGAVSHPPISACLRESKFRNQKTIWFQLETLRECLKSTNGACERLFWTSPRRRGGRIPAAGFDRQANAGDGQRNPRPWVGDAPAVQGSAPKGKAGASQQAPLLLFKHSLRVASFSLGLVHAPLRGRVCLVPGSYARLMLARIPVSPALRNKARRWAHSE